MLGLSAQPGQVPVGEIGQEPGGLVGSFGQVGHALGGPARLVVQPGFEGRADGLVKQLDGQPRITIRGQVCRFPQFALR